jgi:PAS domain S-box-containing protein
MARVVRRDPGAAAVEDARADLTAALAQTSAENARLRAELARLRAALEHASAERDHEAGRHRRAVEEAGVLSEELRAANEALVEANAALERRVEERTAATAESEERLRLALAAGGMGVWEWDIATGAVRWDAAVYRLCGMAGIAEGHRAAFAALLHPDDRARREAALRRALAGDGEYQAEYRIRRGDTGEERWLAARGRVLQGPEGHPVRLIGVSFDVTERRAAEHHRLLLARELDHRAKNALAVVQAALRLTPKDGGAAAYAEAVEGRVAALARAHTLLARGRWEGAGLRALLEAELAPFLPADPDAADPDPDADGDGDAPALPRAALDGPSLTLAPAAAQALSMALHELATNATKHGALGAREGRVAVSWDIDCMSRRLRLRWAESGGPPVAGPPARRGFGSRVVEATVRDQLGGSVERRWEASGLVCEIEAPLERTLVGRESKAARLD